LTHDALKVEKLTSKYLEQFYTNKLDLKTKNKQDILRVALDYYLFYYESAETELLMKIYEEVREIWDITASKGLKSLLFHIGSYAKQNISNNELLSHEIADLIFFLEVLLYRLRNRNIYEVMALKAAKFDEREYRNKRPKALRDGDNDSVQ
jgi:phosphoribosyl-ATP pyrophosphohydrolase